MESPAERARLDPHDTITPAEEADYVSLNFDDNTNSKAARYGFTEAGASAGSSTELNSGDSSARAYLRSPAFQRHNARDRPRSRHPLHGHEPWELVRTQLGRQFAHNRATGESFWRIPDGLKSGIARFEREEKLDEEAKRNAAWAEEQLVEMRKDMGKEGESRDDSDKGRRRRSESLQREDEEALRALLEKEAEMGEEEDTREMVRQLEHIKPVGAVEGAASAPQGGYDTDSSYEEVEVTDSEFEDGDAKAEQRRDAGYTEESTQAEAIQNEGPVEFGEDDIAYQLAAMGESYGLDPGEYGEDEDEEWESGAEGLPLSDEEATTLFHVMLDDHNISPFTPWDKLISDERGTGIVTDDRYTVLPSTRARKEAWETWAKSAAARLQERRAKEIKTDPRVAYLSLLSSHASQKLYWPEFKRKFKREAAMTDRGLNDRDREKLYREHIARLKLPERTRVADLKVLLESIPASELDNSTTLDTLPGKVAGDVRFISLPTADRDKIVHEHIAGLAGKQGQRQRPGDEHARNDSSTNKREAALEARRREVEEQKRASESERRRAMRNLAEEEREIRSAMDLDMQARHREKLRAVEGER